MRLLIDGYNLMHAVNMPLGRKLGPDGLRKARDAFLVRLADRLGPVEAALTTVVFDAADPPVTQSRQRGSHGLTVLFAADADERIEDLIEHHPAPRKLTVVSSDLRLRAAGRRRKATVVGSDAFWTELDARAARERKAAKEAATPAAGRAEPPSPADAAFWQAEFAEVDNLPELREIRRQQTAWLSPEEFDELRREIEAEQPRRKRR